MVQVQISFETKTTTKDKKSFRTEVSKVFEEIYKSLSTSAACAGIIRTDSGKAIGSWRVVEDHTE